MIRTRDYSEDWSAYFLYDESSKSCLRWKINKGSGNNQVKIGQEAGHLNTRNKWVVGLNGKVYLIHVIIFMMHQNLDDNLVVDHINGDSSDNRLSNLRQVSQSVNCRNKKKQSNNTSGITGVSYHKRDKYWSVVYTIEGKQHFEFFYEKDTPFAKELAIARKIELNNTKLTELEFTERHGK